MQPEPSHARPPVRLLTPAGAVGRFLLAALYFFLARTIAQHGARGLVADDWVPLVEQAMFVFLLLFGYAGFGFMFDGQIAPIAQQGLPARAGWLGEFGLGTAFGWAIVVCCVILVLIFGGIALHFSFSLASWAWLGVEAAYFLLATLALQIAFRGYPFQAAMRAMGELPAALLLSVLYGIFHAWLPGMRPAADRAGMAASIAMGLLLAMAYLRTRALWLPWGLQFGWVALRALLFGLPVNGVSSHSPIVQGEALGPIGLSGGDFGFDSSWLAFVAILLAMPLVYRATGELSFLYNAPVLEPRGIPVDLDAAAKRQHELATRESQPEAKPLVQILPVTSGLPPLAADLDGPRD